MLLYILLDLNTSFWIIQQENPLNNLKVFINAFLLSNPTNSVKIINSKTVIFDSKINMNFSTVLDYLKLQKNHETLRITPGDLGFALMDDPSAILIFDVSNIKNNENSSEDYLNYLKSMFIAQRKHILIHAVSLHGNEFIKMCCEATNGLFFENYALSDLFQILGTPVKRKDSYQIKCACCNRFVTLGLVCPVCLSIFCKFLPVCKKCKTKFNFIK